MPVKDGKYVWGYLRECKNKFYDSTRHSTLDEYLSAIFPDAHWIYDSMIPKDIVHRRVPNYPLKRFRPDARCEELNLIVEFDGTAHYQDQSVVLSDVEKDAWLTGLGYKVVRIPYWIQLSNTMIAHLFGVVMDAEMCTLTSSFYDTSIHDKGLSICIGSMSEAGRHRFLDQVTSYPTEIQNIVFADIMHCVNDRDDTVLTEYIVPMYILYRWIDINPDLGS